MANLLQELDKVFFVRGQEAAGVLIRFGIWCSQEGWQFYDGYETMHSSTPGKVGWAVRSTYDLFKEWAATQEDL